MNRRELLVSAGLTGLGLAAGTLPGRAVAAGRGSRRGWTVTPVDAGEAHLEDVASTRGSTWAVGVALLDGFQETRPLAVRHTGGGWQVTPTPVDTHAALTAVAVAAADDVWAVGVDHGDGTDRPLVLRRDGADWRRIEAPDVPAGAFADVVAAPDGSVWAAGWASVDGAERAVVHRYAEGEWQLLGDGLEEAINGNALLIGSDGQAWLALNPGLARFEDSSWTMVEDFPADGSEILTGLAEDGSGGIWAVGVAHTGAGERPLAVGYDGESWQPVETPDEPGQLYDIAIAGSRPVAVGERFVEQPGGDLLFEPYLLEVRDGAFVPADPPAVPEGSTGVLTGVVADRSRLWAVGAVDQQALAARRVIAPR